MNTLYYGDCLTIMREKMRPESVDLVYLDPPFNSNEDYNSIYSDETGRPLLGHGCAWLALLGESWHQGHSGAS